MSNPKRKSKRPASDYPTEEQLRDAVPVEMHDQLIDAADVITASLKLFKDTLEHHMDKFKSEMDAGNEAAALAHMMQGVLYRVSQPLIVPIIDQTLRDQCLALGIANSHLAPSSRSSVSSVLIPQLVQTASEVAHEIGGTYDLSASWGVAGFAHLLKQLSEYLKLVGHTAPDDGETAQLGFVIREQGACVFMLTNTKSMEVVGEIVRKGMTDLEKKTADLSAEERKNRKP